LESFQGDLSAGSLDALERNFLSLENSAEDVLLDTVGLGQKMQEAFDRHESGICPTALRKALAQMY